ncbi:MAG: hypothetical protein Kow0031_02790 [Anaerolineae bacterium]
MNTLPQRLLHHYQQTPDAVCIQLLRVGQPALPLTYRELVQKAAGYAKKLRQYDVQPGEPVMLVLPYGIDLPAAFFGVCLAGAIPSILPYSTEKVDPTYFRQNLSALFQHTQPTAVVTTQVKADDINGHDITAHFNGKLLALDQIESTDSADWLVSKPKDNKVALLQHSSGTTGLQKGVALSHRAIFNQMDAYAAAIKLRPEADVIVSWLPLYHDMGLIAGFLLPVLTGTPLVLMSPFDWVRSPKMLFQAVSDYGGTLSWLPNFAFNFCAHKIKPADLEGINLGTWRAVINCSEPTRLASHRLFFDRFRSIGLRWEALSVCYGMAENVFAVTQSPLSTLLPVDAIDRTSFQQQKMALPASTSDALTYLSAGPPIAGTEVQIVASDGRILPERHVGEITVRGNCLLDEYYRRPDLSEIAFQAGWYLTGDYGYLAGGHLYVVGRKKEIIIVGGKNIYPQDLEAIISNVDGIHPGRVVCFGEFNSTLGTEEITVIAEVEAESEINPQLIKEAVRHSVAAATDVVVRPGRIKLVEPGWIIKTSSGKIVRYANREKYLNAEKKRAADTTFRFQMSLDMSITAAVNDYETLTFPD